MWARNALVVNHAGVATRSAGVGVGTTAINIGEYASGQLICRVVGLGVGAKVKVWWQCSADGTNFANLAGISTLTATGMAVVGCPAGAGPGAWARARWSVATSAKFGLWYVLQS
jgi:hypothetical protein